MSYGEQSELKNAALETRKDSKFFLAVLKQTIAPFILEDVKTSIRL